MRLIDADEAYKVLTDYYHHKTDTQHKALKEALLKVPTIDAKPVVRCKDCRWGHRYDEDLIECPLDLNNPPEYHDEDWYCPNGTRREDGNKPKSI